MNEPVIAISPKMEKLIGAEPGKPVDPTIIRCIGIDPSCPNYMQQGYKGNQNKGKI
jgi:hypothetical protein